MKAETSFLCRFVYDDNTWRRSRVLIWPTSCFSLVVAVGRNVSNKVVQQRNFPVRHAEARSILKPVSHDHSKTFYVFYFWQETKTRRRRWERDYEVIIEWSESILFIKFWLSWFRSWEKGERTWLHKQINCSFSPLGSARRELGTSCRRCIRTTV